MATYSNAPSSIKVYDKVVSSTTLSVTSPEGIKSTVIYTVPANCHAVLTFSSIKITTLPTSGNTCNFKIIVDGYRLFEVDANNAGPSKTTESVVTVDVGPNAQVLLQGNSSGGACVASVTTVGTVFINT